MAGCLMRASGQGALLINLARNDSKKPMIEFHNSFWNMYREAE